MLERYLHQLLIAAFFSGRDGGAAKKNYYVRQEAVNQPLPNGIPVRLNRRQVDKKILTIH